MGAYIEKDHAPATNHNCSHAGGQCHHRHNQQANQQACNSCCHHRVCNNHHQAPRPCHCYRCQRRRGEPMLHPAIGVPLAIATGGLSCAAMGIYRGYANHRALKKSRHTVSERADLEEVRGDFDVEREKEVVLHSVSSRARSSTMESPASMGSRGGHDTGLDFDASPSADAAPPKYSEVEGNNLAGEVVEKISRARPGL